MLANAFDAPRLALCLGLSLLAGGLAFWQGALTASGWAGAVVVGTLTAGLGGWDWGVLVIVFFVSSSALSHFGARRKARFVAGQWEKGSRRDWGQVMANGGLVAALAVLHLVLLSPLLWAAALGVLGTVTGDTWATEVGVLSRREPRLITTGKRVPSGTSGGITLLGSAAAVGGAALIGLAALLLRSLLNNQWEPWVFPATVVGGSAGVVFDSLLGATVQAISWCPRCQAETERRTHACGMATIPLRGWPWLNNDVVNALASVGGAVVAILVSRLW
jgi:uncharacterized protein (TIGR00297 family)